MVDRTKEKWVCREHLAQPDPRCPDCARAARESVSSKIVSSPWLREVRSDLIKLAAAFVRGEVAPDWSEHKWCSTTPVTERRQVMRMLRDMDERIREYGVQLKNIADKLPGSIRADETSGIQAEIDAANRGLRKYIHEQLGFLTTDDNRPAEALIRLAVKRLRPEETSERRDPNEAHDLITPDIGYTPEKAKVTHGPYCNTRLPCDCGAVPSEKATTDAHPLVGKTLKAVNYDPGDNM